MQKFLRENQYLKTGAAMIKNVIKYLIALNIFFLQHNANANSLVNVLYVNGIQNVIEDTKITALKIQKVLDESNNRAIKDKKIFKVNYVWNPIGWYKTEDGRDLDQDLYELFWLKDAESKNYHSFSVLKNVFTDYNNNNSPIDEENTSNAARAITENIVNEMLPSVENQDGPFIERQLGSFPRPVKLYLPLKYTHSAIKDIVREIQEDGKLIVIAHSQGNLLVNLALANAVADKSYRDYSKVRVVNVANTSSFAFSDLNFTHAGDAALFKAASDILDRSLETLPSQKKWRRTLEDCRSKIYCDFEVAPYTFGMPTSNERMQGVIDRFLDHSIIETYLSNDTLEYISNVPIIFTPEAKRFIDRFEDYVYAAVGVTVEESVTITTASCDVDPESGLLNWAVSGVAVSKFRFASIVPVTTGFSRKDFALSSSSSRCVGWDSVLSVQFGGGPYCSRESTDRTSSSWVARYTTPPGFRTIQVASVISVSGLYDVCDAPRISGPLTPCEPFFEGVAARDIREMPDCPGFMDFTGIAK